MIRSLIGVSAAYVCMISGCMRWKATDSRSQVSASSAFEWGQFIMSVIPVNISLPTDTEPHICLFEVNWDHEWTDNPKMWNAIYAKHINALSFDKSYIQKYSQRSADDAEFLKSIIGRFNVACGASGLNRLCLIPPKLEGGAISQTRRWLANAYKKLRQERDKEFSLAIDAADIQVSKSADHLMLLNRIKQIPANVKTGRNCFEHAFDPAKEQLRLREISRHFKPKTIIK